MLTEHSAIRAALETPNLTGKHANWWTMVYGRGVKEVRIMYASECENVSADALSGAPKSLLAYMVLPRMRHRSLL